MQPADTEHNGARVSLRRALPSCRLRGMPAPNVAQPDNEGCLLITATTLRSYAAALSDT